MTTRYLIESPGAPPAESPHLLEAMKRALELVQAGGQNVTLTDRHAGVTWRAGTGSAAPSSPPPVASPAEPATQPCGWCRRPFVPTRRGQLYCSEPQDGTEPCGRQASLARLRDRRAAKGPPLRARSIERRP